MEARNPDRILDLRGVKCPINYVRTKLALEELSIGQVIEVIVDEGEPSRHVPQAIREDGQCVREIVQDESGFVRVIIEKAVEY